MNCLGIISNFFIAIFVITDLTTSLTTITNITTTTSTTTITTTTITTKSKVKVSRDRPRCPKGFRVG